MAATAMQATFGTTSWGRVAAYMLIFFLICDAMELAGSWFVTTYALALGFTKPLLLCRILLARCSAPVNARGQPSALAVLAFGSSSPTAWTAHLLVGAAAFACGMTSMLLFLNGGDPDTLLQLFFACGAVTVLNSIAIAADVCLTGGHGDAAPGEGPVDFNGPPQAEPFHQPLLVQAAV